MVLICTSPNSSSASCSLIPASGPIETQRGLGLIRQAVKAFHAPAILALGELHQRGALVTQDLAEAARLFQQAAALGSADGALHLLQLLRSGTLGAITPTALTELSKVTLGMLHGHLGRGDCSVIRKIARLHHDQAKGKDEIATALRWYEAAARPDRARYWFERARHMQDLDANGFFLLSRAFAAGIGTPQSPKESAAMLQRAAELGHVEAMRELGRAELDTAGSATELADSFAWFERAFEAGEIKAAIDSAAILEARTGVSEALTGRVLGLLERASDLGSARAMREIGLVLQRGRGLKADPEKSAKWLHRAAATGDAIAMREVAMAYASGFGVPLSATRSTEWMKRAAEAGDVKAMRELSSAFKVGFGVSPDQAQAERWAKAASTVPQGLDQ